MIVSFLKRKYAIPILIVLYKRRVVRTSELARAVRGHPTTIGKTLQALEDLKIVGRTPARRNRRAVEVRLTLKGIELVETAMSRWNRVFRKWESLR